MTAPANPVAFAAELSTFAAGALDADPCAQLALLFYLDRKYPGWRRGRPKLNEASPQLAKLLGHVRDYVLVGSDGESAKAIAVAGVNVEHEVDGLGLGGLVDYGCGEPPAAGLWLWTGAVRYQLHRSMDGDEWDSDWLGDWRLATEGDVNLFHVDWYSAVADVLADVEDFDADAFNAAVTAQSSGEYNRNEL